jgi:hypothetical protein
MASTISVQNVLDYARTYPVLTQVLGTPVAGYGMGQSSTAIVIANEVLAEILAEPFNWKWNRVIAPAFLTNSLQQDYPTSITNLSWIETCTRVDINNTSIPKPISGMEVVRELLPTSYQYTPTQLSWVPNAEAQLGTWTPSTTYASGSGANAMPAQPYTAILDSNGNIQVITTYGTTGSTEPGTPVGFGTGFGESFGGGVPSPWATTVGATTRDNTVVWTMVDPQAIAFRLSPLPSQTGTLWQVFAVYQKKPPLITSLAQTWAPIPDELAYVYRQGFLAKALKAADDERYEKEYMLFEALIKKALGSSDREAEEFSMYPGRSIQGGCGAEVAPGSPYPNSMLFPWG